MAGLYLASIAIVTVLTLFLAAQAVPAGQGGVRRFLALAAAWLGLVGVAWPATRLTPDLAFVFGSQAAMLLAIGAWLVGSLRAAGRRPGQRTEGGDGGLYDRQPPARAGGGPAVRAADREG